MLHAISMTLSFRAQNCALVFPQKAEISPQKVFFSTQLRIKLVTNQCLKVSMREFAFSKCGLSLCKLLKIREEVWSSGQRRRLPLQGSWDRIPVFLFLLFGPINSLVSSIYVELKRQAAIKRWKRNKARPAN